VTLFKLPYPSNTDDEPLGRHSKSTKVAPASPKAKAKGYQVGTGRPTRGVRPTTRYGDTRAHILACRHDGLPNCQVEGDGPRVRPLLSQLFPTLTSAAEQAFCDARLARAVVADQG
jgi:hypothetical protein